MPRSVILEDTPVWLLMLVENNKRNTIWGCMVRKHHLFIPSQCIQIFIQHNSKMSSYYRKIHCIAFLKVSLHQNSDRGISWKAASLKKFWHWKKVALYRTYVKTRLWVIYFNVCIRSFIKTFITFNFSFTFTATFWIFIQSVFIFSVTRIFFNVNNNFLSQFFQVSF